MHHLVELEREEILAKLDRGEEELIDDVISMIQLHMNLLTTSVRSD